MRRNLREELRSNRETHSFAVYFEKFLSQPDRWAYCYRLNAGINTNMALENLHRNLKHIYLKGKKVKRLDKGIHALMRFLNFRMRDRLIAIYRGKLTKKLSVLRVRHNESVPLSEKLVVTVSTVLWNVMSCSNTEFYSVSKNLDSCSCGLRCKDCDHCIHAFSCTCADSSILWNMCKHVHLVCRVIKQMESTQSSRSNSGAAAIIPCAEAAALVQQLSSPAQTKNTVEASDLEDRKASLVAKLSEMVQSVKSNAGLEALERHIAPLQFIINSAEKASVSFPEVPAIVQEPSNKKVLPQRKFFSTKKTHVAKKSKPSNPPRSERDAIAFSMVTGLPQDHTS
ncbi:uncharacterized protein LOC126109429 [Schistocerca cancellata]|uniref:uncharacterized protein LOC126109429 n=1 Tax=Schistocerca cancellata TaxID=274614 RepID=UPI002117A2FA|nr:uncharacterized protein LOC126109429 [Schistocerca cancellata]